MLMCSLFPPVGDYSGETCPWIPPVTEYGGEGHCVHRSSFWKYRWDDVSINSSYWRIEVGDVPIDSSCGGIEEGATFGFY